MPKLRKQSGAERQMETAFRALGEPNQSSEKGEESTVTTAEIKESKPLKETPSKADVKKTTPKSYDNIRLTLPPTMELTGLVHEETNKINERAGITVMKPSDLLREFIKSREQEIVAMFNKQFN